MRTLHMGYSGITWGGVTGTASGVGSVADLFYAAHGDTLEAVRDIGEVGYTGLELFDGDLLKFGQNPDQLLETMRTAGVELVSVYTGANYIYEEISADEFAKIERAAALAARFHARKLVLGGGALRARGRQEGDMRALARGLERAAEIAAAAGLEASYHPHLGTLVEAPDALDELFSMSSIPFCPDTAHLAAGGDDPADAIRRYHDRLSHVHLKDLDRARMRFMPLGEGDLDFDDILAAIEEVGYEGWAVVELDEFEGDPKDAARISRQFLNERGVGDWR